MKIRFQIESLRKDIDDLQVEVRSLRQEIENSSDSVRSLVERMSRKDSNGPEEARKR
jgi:predicted  nucleic acid-binding Zn-ribbon protein